MVSWSEFGCNCVCIWVELLMGVVVVFIRLFYVVGRQLKMSDEDDIYEFEYDYLLDNDYFEDECDEDMFGVFDEFDVCGIGR